MCRGSCYNLPRRTDRRRFACPTFVSCLKKTTWRNKKRSHASSRSKTRPLDKEGRRRRRSLDQVLSSRNLVFYSPTNKCALRSILLQVRSLTAKYSHASSADSCLSWSPASARLESVSCGSRE